AAAAVGYCCDIACNSARSDGSADFPIESSKWTAGGWYRAGCFRSMLQEIWLQRTLTLKAIEAIQNVTEDDPHGQANARQTTDRETRHPPAQTQRRNRRNPCLEAKRDRGQRVFRQKSPF